MESERTLLARILLLMALITLQVLDGADRGRRYDKIPTPITIGREEGNAVQLNDERISRFHIKIQEDQNKLVLTDLESTNGTRVNGEQVQLRILRYGDVIAVGRSVLRYGTREQIAKRLDDLRAAGQIDAEELDSSALAKQAAESIPDIGIDWSSSSNGRSTLHIPALPDLPDGLGPGQAAQLSEMIEYLHLRTRALIDSVKIAEEATTIEFNMDQWQEVLELQAILAEYLRKAGTPDGED